jgi:hypothetical protein
MKHRMTINLQFEIFFKSSVLLLGCLLVNCTPDRKITEESIINENIEWSSTWIVNTRDTILPKVLLIGDSHVERYYGKVADKLAKHANCSKFTTSKSLGDPVFIKQLESVLSLCKFDIIIFNNGLHGADFTLKEYSNYAQLAYERLKKNAQKSVILVNSTAMREASNVTAFASRNQQIIERNKFLLEFAQTNQAKLIDFYSATSNNIEYYTPDGVHFNEMGVNIETDLIVKEINEVITN